ncbi:Methyltransferase-like protein 17, mitochondrial [Exaiptasia diaphana]|nr:Methyltransferase-like protein 17, mitochondrial [Exaiptasia diaphana]
MSGLLNKHWLFAVKRSLSIEFASKNATKILSSSCYLHSGKCVNSSNSEVVPAKVDKFAYGADPLAKRDKNAPGLFSLKTIHLPEQLDVNLKKYLERYPRKLLENDGSKLAKHLRNRGRPTETTWKKYKQGRASRKNQDLNVNIDDVMKLKEQESQEVIVDYYLDQDENENKQESCDSVDQIKTNRPKIEEYKVVRYNKRESAAFAASRIPASYGATLRVLHEISRREPDYKPETLLDFGSGTGTAIWAAHSQWSDSIKEYQCIDVSEHMNDIAEYLLRGSESFKRPLHIPYVYFKRFLPISNKVTYDIVISSYSLSEIPRIATRKEAIKNLWEKTNDFLI